MNEMRKLINIMEGVEQQNVNFVKIFADMLRRKYPDTEFNTSEEEISSADGKLQATAWSITDPSELAQEYDDPSLEGCVGVAIWSITTGPYNNVLAKAIQTTTEKILNLVPESKPALITDGQNGNLLRAMEHIAAKLGYPLVDENGLRNTELNKNSKQARARSVWWDPE